MNGMAMTMTHDHGVGIELKVYENVTDAANVVAGGAV